MAGRNPTWVRDELILALDVYLTRGTVGDDHPDVVRMSAVLDALPIHTARPDLDSFRSPSAVALKLANFAALDPGYAGVGMRSGGRLDAEVWDELSPTPELVHSLAAAISEGTSMTTLVDTPEEDEDEVAEGRILFRLHRSRERDQSIIRKKKLAVSKTGQALGCEVCGLVFSEMYGQLGQDYIEVHHRVPLHVSGSTKTRLTDLALVCSNCHRMVHRSKPWLPVEDLRDIVGIDACPRRSTGVKSSQSPDTRAPKSIA